VAPLKLNEKTELAMPLPFFETTPLPVQANVQTSFFDRREMRTRVRFILPSCCRASLVPGPNFQANRLAAICDKMQLGSLRWIIQ